MAKRFTDTEKWKKVWFRKLSPEHKCFWQYLIDNCNHAGIWEVDFELAEFYLGGKLNVDEIKKVFEKQFVEIGSGNKWFIVDFIQFQYNGELNPQNKAHSSIIALLTKENIDFKGLTRGIYAPMDKDKDKVKDMDKDMDKEESEKIEISEPMPEPGKRTEINLEELYESYPKKIGKKQAIKHLSASVKSQTDFENCKTAIANYKKIIDRDKPEDRFIKHASTFFNNWRDYLDIEVKAPDVSANRQRLAEAINQVSAGMGKPDNIFEYILVGRNNFQTKRKINLQQLIRAKYKTPFDFRKHFENLKARPKEEYNKDEETILEFLADMILTNNELESTGINSNLKPELINEMKLILESKQKTK